MNLTIGEDILRWLQDHIVVITRTASVRRSARPLRLKKHVVVYDVGDGEDIKSADEIVMR